MATYNYNKLYHGDVLNALDTYVNSNDMLIMPGDELTVLMVDGYMFTIDGKTQELAYVSGLKGASADQVYKLSRVMSILQSNITLLCFNGGDDNDT